MLTSELQAKYEAQHAATIQVMFSTWVIFQEAEAKALHSTSLSYSYVQ